MINEHGGAFPALWEDILANCFNFRKIVALAGGISALSIPIVAHAQSLPSNPWQTVGNKGTNPAIHYVGNSDNVDLNFRTNNIKRLAIFAGGDIFAYFNMSVGLDLNVLHNLNVGIDGTFGRDVSIGRNLSVALDTTIGRNLVVGNDGTFDHNLSVLNNLSVTVDGSFGHNLTVSNDGSFGHNLSVTNDGTFGHDLFALHNLSVTNDGAVGHNLTVANDAAINGTDQATSTTTGALVVAGGAGVGGNFYVGGETHLSTLRVDGTTDSSSPSTGALVVAGGTGIGKNLNVGGSTNVGGALGVTGATTLHSTASVGGNLTVNPGTVAVTTPNSGSFNVDSNGTVFIHSVTSGDSSNTGHFGLDVKGANQGIVVQLTGAANPADGGSDFGVYSSNHFVDFWDANDSRVGAIEGQTLSEYGSDGKNIALAVLQVADGVALGVSEFEPGNFIQTTASIADYLVNLGIDLANIGVQYSSGSGDYAEFLMRVDESESIKPGDIVGVFGGQISKKTAGAQQILVVSSAPAVVGNQPAAGKESLYNKVAFLGQVPVKVLGRVHEGDYIVPSGSEDGTGIGVTPEMMTAGDFSKVIGRAWTANETDAPGMVKVIVGLNGNDVANMLEKQQAQLAKMQSALDANQSVSAEMLNELAALKAQVADLKQAQKGSK